MKEFLELVDYKITEGSDYGWSCYGNHAYQLSSWNGLHDKGGWSFNIVFSTKSQKVFEVSVCDYTNNRAYRMIAKNKQEAYRKESWSHNVDFDMAWDDINYIDLETDDDFMQKALAIKENKSYDSRVELPIDLDDKELFELMKMAHERDITLNQMIEILLQEVIDRDKSKSKVGNITEY
jgi:hypothetical protein